MLSFALIAIPLGIKVSRKETSANLGLAVALAMAYYIVTIMVGWVDNAGNETEFRIEVKLLGGAYAHQFASTSYAVSDS